MVRPWLLSIITILFLSSTLRLTVVWEPIAISILYMSLILIVLSLVLFKKIELKYNSYALILMSLFLFFGLLSALINQDVKLLMRACVFFFLFLSASIIIPSYFKENTEEILTRVIIVSHLPLILIPIILDRGIKIIPYSGIFSNANSLGGVAVSVLAIFAAMLLKDIEDLFTHKKIKSKKYMLLNILFIFSLLLLISYTSSRTSFITGLVILFFGLLLVLINMFRYKKTGNFFVKILAITPITLITYYILNLIFPLQQGVSENILSKFERKSQDILDGRALIWEQAFNKSGFFGGGSDLFYGNITKGAHNTFISVLGNFGWIPMIIIILFFIIAFYYSLKHFFTSKSNYKYLAPLMIVVFLTLSITEDMNYKLSIIASMSLAGISMNQKKIIITK